MARYYDIDKLAEMIQAKADTLIDGKEAFFYVAKWLELLPAADVVPKTDVEWLRAEVERLSGELIVETTRRKNAVNAYNEARQKVARKIFAEINNILSDDINDTDETMAYDEQAAAYYEAELCRIVEQIKQLEKNYEECGNG